MTGNLRHVINMANSIVGVSILSMPYCFKESGLVLGVILILLSGVVTKRTCMFLVRSAVMSRRRSYELLAFQMFGVLGKFLMELCMILFLVGICISFNVVMGDLSPAIVAKYLAIENSPALRATLLVGMMLLIILPLCLLRNIESLASMSACSIGFYILLNLVVFASAIPRLIDGSLIKSANLFDITKALKIFPITMLGLSCQSTVFEIYDSIPEADIPKMRTVVSQAVDICCALYIGVGFMGYIAFLEKDIGGNIIMSFPVSALTDGLTMFFVVSLAISFPLVMFPCRTSIHSLIYKRGNQLSYELGLVGNYMPEVRFKIITIGVLFLSLGVGLLIPNIEFVLGLLGSTMGMMISIILPSIFFIRVYTKFSFERILAQSFLFAGLFLMIIGTFLHLGGMGSNKSADVIEIKSLQDIKSNDFKLPLSVVNVDKVNIDVNVKSRMEPAIPEPPIVNDSPIVAQKILSSSARPKMQIIEKLESADVLKQPENVKIENRHIDDIGIGLKLKDPIKEALDVDLLAKKESLLRNSDIAEKIVVNDAEESLHPDAINKAEKEHAVESNAGDKVEIIEKKKEELINLIEQNKEIQEKVIEVQKELIQEFKEQDALNVSPDKSLDVPKKDAKASDHDRPLQNLDTIVKKEIIKKPENSVQDALLSDALKDAVERESLGKLDEKPEKDKVELKIGSISGLGKRKIGNVQGESVLLKVANNREGDVLSKSADSLQKEVNLFRDDSERVNENYVIKNVKVKDAEPRQEKFSLDVNANRGALRSADGKIPLVNADHIEEKVNNPVEIEKYPEHNEARRRRDVHSLEGKIPIQTDNLNANVNEIAKNDLKLSSNLNLNPNHADVENSVKFNDSPLAKSDKLPLGESLSKYPSSQVQHLVLPQSNHLNNPEKINLIEDNPRVLLPDSGLLKNDVKEAYLSRDILSYGREVRRPRRNMGQERTPDEEM